MADFAFIERFEGITEDSQAVAGYDNEGWVSTDSVNNPNYTTAPAPLSGVYSYISGATFAITNASIGATYTECWAYFQCHSGAVNVGMEHIFSLHHSSGSLVVGMKADTTATQVEVKHGSVTNTSATSVWAPDTTYHVWIRFQQGTGADGEADVYVSTTSTIPASAIATTTAGNSTFDVDRASVRGEGIAFFDSLAIDADPIGSAPLDRQEYPATLPRYQRTTTLDVVTDKARTNSDTALFKNRRRSETKIYLVKVEWLFDESELAIFQAWFDVAISSGSQIFDIVLALGGGIVTNTAKFGKGEYSFTFTGNKDWHVIAQLEVWKPAINDTVAEFYAAHEALFVTSFGTTPIASMWLPLSLATGKADTYNLELSQWLDLSTATGGS